MGKRSKSTADLPAEAASREERRGARSISGRAGTRLL